MRAARCSTANLLRAERRESEARHQDALHTAAYRRRSRPAGARKQRSEAEDSSLLLPFGGCPASIPAAAQAEYRNRRSAIVRDKIYPRSVRSLNSWRANTCRLRGRHRMAHDAGGEASYRYLVREQTPRT